MGCDMKKKSRYQKDKRAPIYLGYEQIATKVESLTPDIIAQHYDALVIILRGGSFPGMHIAFLTDIPIYFVTYTRHNQTVSWNGKIPERNAKILIVEDFAGRGTTLTDTMAYLQSDYQVHTFVVCKDELSRVQRPTYTCFNLKDKNTRFIVPWEKHEYEESMT